MQKKSTLLAKIAINSNNNDCLIGFFIFMTFHFAYKQNKFNVHVAPQALLYSKIFYIIHCTVK